MDGLKDMYALITPAYNEEKYITNTIESVLAQTLLPVKWVIVSDGSTDHTDEIITQYAENHDFIHYLRLEKNKSAGNFAAKVFAFNAGYELMTGIPYAFIGNMDGDVSFDAHYFERILQEFHHNPGLGIAGGRIFEETDGRLQTLSFDDMHYVSGRIQLFRRECYEVIGGYRPVPAGGEDTIAVVMARMHGWECTIYPHLQIVHHKKSTSARGFLRESFRDGAKDYSLGSHPAFQVLKSVNRIRQKPYLLASLVRMLGFLWQYLSKQERLVSKEFVKVFRLEQGKKVKSMLHGIM
jgi:glycosyltransferase involved in cell wall biosynthesis